MAKNRFKNSPEQNEKFIAEGRGQGRLEEYISGVQVTDFSSSGKSSRRRGALVDRPYNLLSDGESDYLSCIEVAAFAGNVEIIDIREEVFLLPQTTTIEIANSLGIKHPSADGYPIIMSTDFVITFRREYDEFDIARAFKQSNDLLKPNTLEHLEIARIYWERRQINWGIVTELQIPETLRKNSRRFRKYLSLDKHPITKEQIKRVSDLLFCTCHPTTRHLTKFVNR